MIGKLAPMDTVYLGSVCERSIASHIVAYVKLMPKFSEEVVMDSIISPFKEHQKLHIVAIALSQLGWEEDWIKDVYEQEAYMSLVFQLAYLQHPGELYFPKGEISLMRITGNDWKSYAESYEIPEISLVPRSDPETVREQLIRNALLILLLSSVVLFVALVGFAVFSFMLSVFSLVITASLGVLGAVYLSCIGLSYADAVFG
jgi:hypothetical protein